MKLFYFILLIPSILFADAVFKINEKEYRDLDDIALQAAQNLACDKGSNGHNYTEIYSFYFSHLRDKPLKILEIGVFRGGSVQLWENYFTNADLHFIDITFQYVQYFSNRSKYYLADQANPDQLKAVIQQIGEPLDIIIDDGGHTMNQQITSFITLWPHLKSGGIYVIEDLHTS